MWRRAKKEGLNFEACQLGKLGRRRSSNGDSEGAPSEPREKSGNDDPLVSKEGKLFKNERVINHDRCY